jgi:hypothetical protein
MELLLLFTSCYCCNCSEMKMPWFKMRRGMAHATHGFSAVVASFAYLISGELLNEVERTLFVE